MIEMGGSLTESKLKRPEELDDAGPLRIGTRGSPLARWQAGWVADRLRAEHPVLTVELVEIKTHGDRDRNTPLSQLGGLGLFTKEIQRALLEGAVEIAVHSLKDLPTQGPAGLAIGAVPPREGLADALIAPTYKTLDALPDGATVGTGSLRRRAQLLFLRPGLNVVGLRGNVETRLNQALEGRLDAVVLAEAGLRRLGLDRHVTERLAPPRFLPAVGQGALAIECRDDDLKTLAFLDPLDDPVTRRAVLAERRALAELEGGCMIPLGAWGRDTEAGGLALDVAVFDPDGRERAFATLSGPRDDPDDLGRRVAAALRALGAERLLSRPASASGSPDATGADDASEP
jgi:hydroxymethylbilane synthase